MPSNLPNPLSEIKQAIDESISSIEARLDSIADELRVLLSDLEQERAQVQGQMEERALDRLLGTLHRDPTLPMTGELRRQEDQVTRDYTRVSALYRQLTDFHQLLTASRQQLRTEEKLPGMDDAHRLAIRQAMIRAQEDERRRLAREVHDGPAQVLANAIIGLEFVERSLQLGAGEAVEQSVDEIGRVKSALREGLTEIRRFIFDLRPTMLSQRGLAATVEHYLDSYRSFFSSEVELIVEGDIPRLSPEQELTAFRVIQESLQNVQRHARSNRAWVRISVHEDELVVIVRDDGQGFSPAAARTTAFGGFGLSGMRERAEVIGGRLSVWSEPGRGTTITLVIPLAPQLQPSSPHLDPHDASMQTKGDCRL